MGRGTGKTGDPKLDLPEGRYVTPKLGHQTGIEYLKAGGGGLGVLALATACLFPPLLVRGPAARRIQATPTATGKLILHL